MYKVEYKNLDGLINPPQKKGYDNVRFGRLSFVFGQFFAKMSGVCALQHCTNKASPPS